MATKVTDTYFEYGTQKYFRGNAHLVEICTFGEKKNPLFSGPYIDPQSKIQREYVASHVIKGLTASIDWSEAKQADVEVNGTIKAFKIGATAAASYSFSSVKSANLKLYNLYINESPLKSLLNGDASGALHFLANEGLDGRIVSEVWIVMEATLAEQFDTATSVTVAASGSNLNVTAKGGKSGTQTITLSAGSVFAYKTHKVNNWNSDKTKVEGLEADYYGMS